MKKWYVYLHISPSKKVYVGITSKKYVSQRWHRGLNYKGCKHFYNAILKYGWDNILHIVLCKATELKAKLLENTLIKYYKHKNLSYNITDGGDGTVGLKWNDNLRISHEKSFKGKHLSEYTKALISKKLTGIKRTEAQKLKYKESHKFYKPTEETLQKIREANKGRIPSKNAVLAAKIANSKKVYVKDIETGNIKLFLSQTEAAKFLQISNWKVSTYINTNNHIRQYILFNMNEAKLK